MKKLILMLILLCCASACFANLIPTFNGSSQKWIDHMENSYNLPVANRTDSFGLTNPNDGKVPYDFKLHVEIGRVYWDIPDVLPDGVNVFVDDGDLFINGIADGTGTGTVVDNIIMNLNLGGAGVYVYEMNFIDGAMPYEYVKIGVFAVAYGVIPEPATMFLLSFGALLLIPNRKGAWS